MKKALIALAAAATVATATVAVPSTADARCRGCGVAAGIFGGLVAGTIIGNAIAGPPVYYDDEPIYAGPAPGPECYYARRRVWDEVSRKWQRGPRELVCP